MCDEGRHGYHYLNSKVRFSRTVQRVPDGATTKWQPTPYVQSVAKLNEEWKLRATAKPDGVWVTISPFLTVEEAYLVAKFAKQLSSKATLVLGHVPFVGEDDQFPKDRRGNVKQPAKFTIRAEKAPNRRGVEEVLKKLQGEIIPLARLNDAIQQGKVESLIWTGGYPSTELLAGQALTSLERVPFLVATSLFADAITAHAHWVVPSAGFTEKDGTFVNHGDLAQCLKKATQSPGEARSEGQLFHDLLGRNGLFRSDLVRTELAKEIPFFSKLPAIVPENGIKL
ncbi:MAG: molybdopterin-dependent oxidoreductase [Zavarzinella sp.]